MLNIYIYINLLKINKLKNLEKDFYDILKII